jgi:hypothetical protein
MEKKIAWESWNAKEHEFIESDNDIPELEEMPEGEEISNLPILMMQPRTITTPFGVYDQSSIFKPSERWDCWICHTNFNITQEIVGIINEANGVESLVIMGRYTFCIGIAKLFESADVKAEIEEKLKRDSIDKSFIEDEKEITDKINNIQENPYWSILIKDTGEIDYAVSQEDNEDYRNEIKKLEILKEKNGGQIFYSEIK